jgi:hypothetical protein
MKREGAINLGKAVFKSKTYPQLFLLLLCGFYPGVAVKALLYYIRREAFSGRNVRFPLMSEETEGYILFKQSRVSRFRGLCVLVKYIVKRKIITAIVSSAYTSHDSQK